ncbi:MAG: hypothetical protein ACWGMZ_05540 [Thermoguttaceae bacterium]
MGHQFIGNGGIPKKSTEAGYGPDVALGQVIGRSAQNITATREGLQVAVKVDVWSYTGQDFFTLSTTADIDTLSSSSAADVGAAYTMLVKGLDANYTPVNQFVVPNGQNKVTLTTPLIRVYQVINVGTTPTAGDIYLYVDTAIVAGVPTDTTKVRGFSSIDEQSFSTSLVTVPDGHYGILRGIAMSLIKKTATLVQIYTVQKLYNGVIQERPIVALNTNGTSAYVRQFEFGGTAPPRTDFWLRAESDSPDVGVTIDIEVEFRSVDTINTNLLP